MGVISKISIRNMSRRKSRYFLTTFTLVIGVTLFGGVMIVANSFQSTMLSSIDSQLGTADILLRTNNTDLEPNGWFDPLDINDTLQNIDNVRRVAFRISGFDISISGVDSGNQVENSTNCQIYGIDINNPEEPEIGGVPYILDVIPEMESSTTIEELLTYQDTKTNNQVMVITESLQVKLGKEPGEIIHVLPYNDNITEYDISDTSTWEEFTIVAVIRDSGEGQDVNPQTGKLITLSRGINPVVFTTIDNAHRLVDGTKNRTGLFNLGVIDLVDMYIAQQSSSDIESALAEINSNSEWIVFDLKSSSIEDIETTMETMDIMFTIFGFVALILSTVLIVNIFNIIREEQEYETGMFQAIGASKGETFKIFLIQGTIMGVIGAAIGTVLSYFLAKAIFSVTMNTMINIAQTSGQGMSVGIIDFSIVLVPSTIIYTFSIGFISCLVASIFPSINATRKPIIECLNPIEEQNRRIKKKYFKSILPFLFGAILIVGGVFLLFQSFGNIDFARPINGTSGSIPGMGGSEQVTAMVGPVMILFGLLIIGTVFINPLIKGLIILFKPFLKQTRLLTEKNILRHPKRTILTFLLISLTTSYLIGMSVIMDSMRAGVDTTIDDMIGADMQVFAFAPSTLEDDIMNLDSVNDILMSSMQNALIKSDDEWVGHDLLDEDYNETVSINVIEPNDLKALIEDSKIISPSNISTNDIVEELKTTGTILITEEFSKDYNVHAGDSILVNFTLDITYPDFEAQQAGNITDAKVNYYAINMNIIAVVNKVQGFGLSSMMSGGGIGTTYQMFVSWDEFSNEISTKSLPGQDTDLILRKPTNTGNAEFDQISSSWFNISEVDSLLSNYESWEYTTRMDYPMITNLNPASPLGTDVIGIHTTTNGKIQSDISYGSNILLEKNSSYSGNTLEELLNNTENICVVDQEYVNAQLINDTNFGIGSKIKIFPHDFSSPHSPYDDSTWPTFEIVGIIDNSKLYNTEKYFWSSEYESFVLPSGNCIYLNYNTAAEQIFVNYRGSDLNSDNITSILINSNSIVDLKGIKSELKNDLLSLTGENWTIAEIKTMQYQIRNMVISWYIWLEEGANQEEILKEIQKVFQDNNAIVIFGFTRDFATSTFSTMINLMTFIMYGILFLAILIALIGLALHCLLTTMSRRREIGMLRSIGLSKQGIIRSISGETLIIALIGVIIGIGAGLIQGSLSVLAMPSGGFLAITYVIPWPTISILIVITVLAAILSSMLPARWAAKLNIIDEVRTR